MAFRLPRWSQGNPATDARGRITPAFKTYLDAGNDKIEEQEARQDGIDTELQDAVADLEVLTEAMGELLDDTAALAGQVNAFITYYEPFILENRTRIEALEAP